MRSTNTVIIVGRLTRDAEIRQVNPDTELAVFDIAWSTSKKGPDGSYEDVPNYIQVQHWKPGGLKTYLVKGRQIVVTGELNFQTWEKDDGSKGYKHFIRATHIELVGGQPAES